MKRRDFLASGGALLAMPASAREAAAPVDDSGRPVDPLPPGSYPYRGVSAPSAPGTAGNVGGGWTSGGSGVRYRGPQQMPYELLPWNDSATGSAVTAGLIPAIAPLIDVHIGDTQICRGGDSAYHESVPCAGGGGFFRDRDGAWWTTFFGNDNQSPFREMPGILRIDFTGEGRVVAARDQPFARWVRAPAEVW